MNFSCAVFKNTKSHIILLFLCWHYVGTSLAQRWLLMLSLKYTHAIQFCATTSSIVVWPTIILRKPPLGQHFLGPMSIFIFGQRCFVKCLTNITYNNYPTLARRRFAVWNVDETPLGLRARFVAYKTIFKRPSPAPTLQLCCRPFQCSIFVALYLCLFCSGYIYYS